MRRFRVNRFHINRIQIAVGIVAIAAVAGLMFSQEQAATQFLSRQIQAERNFKDPVFFPQENTPRWPLTSATQKYAPITGEHLRDYVKDLTEISHHSRDRGEQLWGRITGTQGDQETRAMADGHAAQDRRQRRASGDARSSTAADGEVLGSKRLRKREKHEARFRSGCARCAGNAQRVGN